MIGVYDLDCVMPLGLKKIPLSISFQKHDHKHSIFLINFLQYTLFQILLLLPKYLFVIVMSHTNIPFIFGMVLKWVRVNPQFKNDEFENSNEE